MGLKGSDDGDRQMVKVLGAVLSDGLAAVEAACAEALANADVILNVLARRQQPPPPQIVSTPERLILREPPVADCAPFRCAAQAFLGNLHGGRLRSALRSWS